MAYQWHGGGFPGHQRGFSGHQGYPGQQGGYPGHHRGFSGHQGYPGHQQGYSGPYESQYGPPGGPNGYGSPPPGPPPPPPNHSRPSWEGSSYSPVQQNFHGHGGFGSPPGGPQYQAPPQYGPPQGTDNYGYAVDHGRPPFHGYREVPQAPQQFGQGAPSGYTFQYSNCTGQRKALLIGINYLGQKNELRGCINDVKNLSEFLTERYNYKREDMVILTDDQSDPVRQPTKANIIRAMGWLVQGAQPGDSLFLHFSGHGGQTEDLDGDEDDGFDEVIYPVDFQSAGHIVDDDIHDMCVKPLMQGVRLTAIFDSCHSGTVMDLPYVYSTKGVLKEPNLAAEAGQGALSAFSAYASGDISGVISSVMGFAKKAMNGDDAYNRTMATKTSPADVIMFSGSKDDQTSADAMIATEATGAMSWAFVTALKQNPQQTYVQLLNSIRDVLATKYTQKPQLSCSHPLDTNILFIM